jgi:hypothetical protein
LAALELALGHLRQRPQLYRFQPGLQPVEPEGETTRDKQTAVGLGRVERPQHRRQHRCRAGCHPVWTAGVGHQDLFQVIDDQQQRPLPVTGLRARTGQQIDQ